MRMVRTFISIVIIVAAVLGIALYAAPQYQNTKDLRLEVAELEDALAKAAQLRAVREQLQNRYNSFTAQQLEDLEIILPPHVDNVRLSLDIERLAAANSLVLQDVSVIEPETAVEDPEAAANPLGSVDIEFSVAGSYDDFVEFLDGLERSLRVIDIRSLTFQADEARRSDVTRQNDYFIFNVVVSTYWLRSV